MNVENDDRSYPGAKTLALLRKAFPDGIADEDLCPLVAVMSASGMPHRAIAEDLGRFLNIGYHAALDLVWNQGAFVLNDDYPPPCDQSEIDRIIARLKPFGYDEWLKED